MPELDDIAVLLSYQQDWVADDSEVKVGEKGRRVGLSWSDASEKTMLAAASKKAGGMDCWYIGYNKEMAFEYISDVAFWTKHFNEAVEAMEECLIEDDVIDEDGKVIDDEKRDILAYRIKFSSGHRVTALSSKPNNLRGKQGAITIDEAAFHDDLPGLLKAAMALLMWGGRLAIISTHNGVDNDFNKLINDIRAERKDYSLHRITIDDALEQGLYKRICLRRGIEWTIEGELEWRATLFKNYGADADEELLCIPTSSAGKWLPHGLIESCMEEDIPIIEWEQPDEFSQTAKHLREAECKEWCEEHLKDILKTFDKSLNSFFGEDFARNGDVSSSVFGQRDAFLNLHTRFVLEMRNIPHEQQKQVLFYILDGIPNLAGGKMDAGGNGAYLAEVTAQKYTSEIVEEVMFSVAWYRDNTPAFKAAIEDKEITYPKHDNILQDLRSFEIRDGVARISQRTTDSDGKKRHGDTAIALLLMYQASKNPARPFEFIPLGNSRVGASMEGY